MTKSKVLKAWLAPLIIVATMACHQAEAQSSFPNRSIRVINPLAAGGALDVLLRRIGDAYMAKTGQGFVVDSKPGANTIIAAESCASALADGYTICLLTSSTVSLNPSLYKKLPYEIPKSFAPITEVAVGQEVLVIQSSIPARDFKQFVAYSKANPGKLNYASLGVGGDVHLAIESLKRSEGTDWTHVPYKGFGPLMTAFAQGEVHMGLMLVGNPNLVNEINTGHLRALAVLGDVRSPLIPSVPTFAEAGIPLESNTWFGLFAPAGTPPAIVEKLNSDIAAILKSPDFVSKYLTPQGFEGIGNSTAEFARYIDQDLKKGAELVKISGVSLD